MPLQPQRPAKNTQPQRLAQNMQLQPQRPAQLMQPQLTHPKHSPAQNMQNELPLPPTILSLSLSLCSPLPGSFLDLAQSTELDHHHHHHQYTKEHYQNQMNIDNHCFESPYAQKPHYHRPQIRPSASSPRGISGP